jgi:NDP-sugar pyrophosphorylase family protein
MHPLGTAGALATIDGLADAFLAMNGDILTTLDYADMYRYHKAQNASLTVAITRKSVQIELGVLELDQDHRIIGYDEKPVMTYQASMGVYIYEPRLKEMMVPGEYLDVPNLVLKMIEKGERIAAYSPDVFWLDMGNRTDYEKADEEVAKNPNAFIPSL